MIFSFDYLVEWYYWILKFRRELSCRWSDKTRTEHGHMSGYFAFLEVSIIWMDTWMSLIGEMGIMCLRLKLNEWECFTWVPLTRSVYPFSFESLFHLRRGPNRIRPKLSLLLKALNKGLSSLKSPVNKDNHITRTETTTILTCVVISRKIKIEGQLGI